MAAKAIDAAILAEANKRLFEPYEGHAVKRTQACLVSGCRGASGEAARVAGGLYVQGAFSTIILMGGAKAAQPEVFLPLFYSAVLNSTLGKNIPGSPFAGESLRDLFAKGSEMDYMERELLAMGVPQEAIIRADNQGRHLNKNVEGARDILKEFSSVTVVTYAPLVRRTIGTLRFQGHEMPVATVMAKPFGLEVDTWHESFVSRHVLDEARHMDPGSEDTYVGVFTTEVNIEDEAEKTALLPDLTPAG